MDNNVITSHPIISVNIEPSSTKWSGRNRLETLHLLIGISRKHNVFGGNIEYDLLAFVYKGALNYKHVSALILFSTVFRFMVIRALAIVQFHNGSWGKRNIGERNTVFLTCTPGQRWIVILLAIFTNYRRVAFYGIATRRISSHLKFYEINFYPKKSFDVYIDKNPRDTIHI